MGVSRSNPESKEPPRPSKSPHRIPDRSESRCDDYTLIPCRSLALILYSEFELCLNLWNIGVVDHADFGG